MRQKGNITVFAAMCIMLVAAVLFTLLEAARIRQMELLGAIVTDSVLESIFAGYDLPLWDKYHLLARSTTSVEKQISFGNMETEMEELAEAAMNPSSKALSISSNDLLRGKTDFAEVTGYSLITDEGGKVFEYAVAEYMKMNLGYEAAKQLKALFEQGQKMEEMDLDEAIVNAQEEIVSAEEETDEGGSESRRGNTLQMLSENPLGVVIRLKQMGILSLLLEDTSQVSQSQIRLQETLSQRTLCRGTQRITQNQGWYEKVLVNQYYASHYANFLSPGHKGTLQYEQEYLICGKASDIENLKGCVNRILIIREAGNMLYLLQDTQKQSEALALATILAGASANPGVIEAVRNGILAAWAYIESILDLRALLQGDKIPLVKNSQQWTSDIDGFSQCASPYHKANKCSNGLTYQEYLNLLLYTNLDSSMAYRALDIQESYLRTIEGYEDFQMDQMIVAMSVKMQYEFSENYLSLVHLGNLGNPVFVISCDSSYSYISNNIVGINPNEVSFDTHLYQKAGA